MPYTEGRPRPGAALALGGEERLDAAAAGLLVHADAGVDDLDAHRLPPSPSSARVRVGIVERAAVGHGVDRVEDEIGERIAKLAPRRPGSRAVDAARSLCSSIDDAALLRQRRASAAA